MWGDEASELRITKSLSNWVKAVLVGPCLHLGLAYLHFVFGKW